MRYENASLQSIVSRIQTPAVLCSVHPSPWMGDGAGGCQWGNQPRKNLQPAPRHTLKSVRPLPGPFSAFYTCCCLASLRSWRRKLTEGGHHGRPNGTAAGEGNQYSGADAAVRSSTLNDSPVALTSGSKGVWASPCLMRQDHRPCRSRRRGVRRSERTTLDGHIRKCLDDAAAM